MTRQDMLILLRIHLSDEQAVGWPIDLELVAFLDMAANTLSEQLIAAKDPIMLSKVASTASKLPADFVSFQGNVPVSIVGSAMEYYGERPTDLLYWARFPLPSSFKPGDNLPYTSEACSLIIDIARTYALNKNEYDISQDIGMQDRIRAAMETARKG